MKGEMLKFWDVCVIKFLFLFFLFFLGGGGREMRPAKFFRALSRRQTEEIILSLTGKKLLSVQVGAGRTGNYLSLRSCL